MSLTVFAQRERELLRKIARLQRRLRQVTRGGGTCTVVYGVWERSRCYYCGAPVRSKHAPAVCSAHIDLLEMDVEAERRLA